MTQDLIISDCTKVPNNRTNLQVDDDET